MAYGLDEFCADVQGILGAGDGPEAREQVRVKLEELLHNQDFVQATCGDDAEIGIHTLYHDPDLDFMVLAHIYDEGRTSPPHDHGASWAVYGQALGWTDMTEYDPIDGGEEGDIEISRKYRLEPGNAGVFGPHQIHSIHFEKGGRFVRVTGTDLSHIATRRFDMANHSVTKVDPNPEGVAAGSAPAAE